MFLFLPLLSFIVQENEPFELIYPALDLLNFHCLSIYKRIFSHAINYHCLLYYRMHPFDNRLIYSMGLLSLLLSFYNFSTMIINQSKVKIVFKRLPHWVSFLPTFYFKLLLGFLVLILALLIVDLFVIVNSISVNWYQYLSPGVIKLFLWDVSKPDIHIVSPLRFVEVHGEGDSWV